MTPIYCGSRVLSPPEGLCKPENKGFSGLLASYNGDYVNYIGESRCKANVAEPTSDKPCKIAHFPCPKIETPPTATIYHTFFGS